MANTYTSLHYHVIFSTKNRESWIRPDIEQRLWSYMGGIARENDMTAVGIGGIDDHLHLLLNIPPMLALSNAVKLIKGGSSKWAKDLPGLASFRWQDGYAAFTVSKSNLPEVLSYVGKQREHHRGKSFAQEYRALLDRHGIQYDERYMFDAEIAG